MTVSAQYETAASIEARFARKQQAHRLAIHQWENIERFEFPKNLQNELADGHAKDRLFSMSLLPGGTNGRAMLPFVVTGHNFMRPGYLFDLEQRHPDAPKVLRASSTDLHSGYNTSDKRMRAFVTDAVPALAAFYKECRGDELEVRRRMTGPEGAKLTEHKLNALGAYIDETPKHLVGPFEDNVIHWNELLATVRPRDVAAISISLTQFEGAEDAAWYRPFQQLQGAIAGLQHLERGIDLPVVFYHVGGPDQGRITFLGQGKAQLEEKAHEAITEIQTRHLLASVRPPCITSTTRAAMCKTVQHFLGIDMEAPILTVQQQASPLTQKMVNHSAVGKTT